MTHKKIRYMIVDDEPMAHRIILNYCKALPDLELVKQSYDAFEAMEFLRHNDLDLMFLDLNMPDLNGFELLRTLKDPPEVIVTTAHEEFALEGYELNVRDYLVKPFRLERFLAAVNKIEVKGNTEAVVARVSNPGSSTEVLVVKGDKKHHRVVMDEVLYVEACGNYCYLVTERERIMTHQTLSGLEKQLDQSMFMRVHKSFVIGTRKVTAISASSIEIGEHDIPIGQTYKQQVQRLVKG